ncbi:MAG: alpha/beta hydrolase [Candidatus Kariarchaeaceae archaeon]|jgi:carboxylesterase
MDHSKYCIVTCHGFTGYPEEMDPLGKYFVGKGFSWSNLTLPGHGTTPKDLRNTTWKDWTNHMEQELKDKLQQYPDGVFFSGLSLGGVMTLYAMQEYPQLKGGIPMSAPVNILNWWQKIATKLPIGFWVKRTETDLRDIYDKEAAKDHRAYETFHSDSAKQVHYLVSHVRKNLSRITQPILIVHSSRDNSVPLKNAFEIYEKVNSKIKEKLIVDNSGHVVTRDLDKEIIFGKSFEFINTIIKS